MCPRPLLLQLWLLLPLRGLLRLQLLPCGVLLARILVLLLVVCRTRPRQLRRLGQQRKHVVRSALPRQESLRLRVEHSPLGPEHHHLPYALLTLLPPTHHMRAAHDAPRFAVAQERQDPGCTLTPHVRITRPPHHT